MVFLLTQHNHATKLSNIFSNSKITDYFTCSLLFLKTLSIDSQKEIDTLLHWLSPYPQVKEVQMLRRKRVTADKEDLTIYKIWLQVPKKKISHKQGRVIYRYDQQCIICYHHFPNFSLTCKHEVYCNHCVLTWACKGKKLSCAECYNDIPLRKISIKSY